MRLTTKALLGFLLFAALTYAKSVPELLQSPTRPSMQEIRSSAQDIDAYFSKEKPHEMKSGQGGQAPSYYLDILLKGGPHFIASLEKTFPGATWAFMGRDTQLIADLVEAFYLSIGQPNRVVRIGSSKPTVTKLVPDQVMRLLEQKGFSLDRYTSNPPFILVDTISKGYGDQGRKFIQVVYTEAENRGIPAAKLLRKFNLFGLVVSTFSGDRNDFDKAEEILTEETARYLQPLSNSFYDEHTIITLPERIPLFNETGYEHFTFAWHASYGALREGANGHIDETPGLRSQVDICVNILDFQNKIWKHVNRTAFLEEVRNAASQLGYEFPVDRVPVYNEEIEEPEPAPPLDPETAALVEAAQAIDEEIENSAFDQDSAVRAIISGMTKPDPKEKDVSPTSMSENGEKLLEWYTQNKGGSYNPHRFALAAFRAARLGRKGVRLRGVDLRILIRLLLSDTKPSFTLAREFAAFSHEARAFHDMLYNDESWIQGHDGYETFLKTKQLMELKPPKEHSCAEEFLGESPTAPPPTPAPVPPPKRQLFPRRPQK